MKQGFFLMYRKLWDNPISQKPKYLAVWLYLISHANYKDKSVIWNNKNVEIKRGQFVGSISKIAQHFDMSTGTVSYILDYLISERMVEKSSNYRFTVFTVKNYDQYQNLERISESKLKANEKQAETTNKDNNNNNNNNNKKESIKEKRGRSDRSTDGGTGTSPSTSSEGSIDEECWEIVNYFNEVMDRRFDSIKSLRDNWEYWRDDYCVDEVKEAIDVIPSHHFWKDKITPTILLRQKNQNQERVNYIGDLLNYEPRDDSGKSFRRF